MGLGEAMMICGKKDGEILYMEPSLPTISLQIGKERAATRASTGRQEHPSSEVTLGRNQLTANSHAGGGGGGKKQMASCLLWRLHACKFIKSQNKPWQEAAHMTKPHFSTISSSNSHEMQESMSKGLN